MSDIGAIIAGVVLVTSRIGWEAFYRRRFGSQLPRSRWYHHGMWVAFGLALIFAGAGAEFLGGLFMFVAIGIGFTALARAQRERRRSPR